MSVGRCGTFASMMFEMRQEGLHDVGDRNGGMQVHGVGRTCGMQVLIHDVGETGTAVSKETKPAASAHIVPV